jgi:hypothetical protein
MAIPEAPLHARKTFKGIPSNEERIASYLGFWRTSKHGKWIVVRFAKTCMDDLESLHSRMQEKFRAVGWHVDALDWDKFNAFNALAQRDSRTGKYRITIAIEVPPSLLSMSHELSSPAGTSKKSPSWWERLQSKIFSPRTSIDRWLGSITSEDDVSEDVKTWAQHACRLLYFHELSHVSMGHLEVSAEAPLTRRALEFDADFNAGSYFAATALAEGLSADEVAERLIRASLLLAAALKIVSTPTDEYHYPTIRCVAFIQGGIFFLTSNRRKQNALADQIKWEALATTEADKFANAMRKSSLHQYAGEESTLEADMLALQTQTIPTREDLKNGPLMQFSIRVPPFHAPPFHQKVAFFMQLPSKARRG